jgi:hypothetical protein
MSAMTLDQKIDRLRRVADGLRRIREFESAGYLDEYRAHLTAHAQMVEKVREVITELRATDVPLVRDHNNVRRIADKLAAAIGEEK